MLTLLLSLLLASPDISDAYRIEAPKAVKVKKGVAGQARIEVVPRSDAHVSPDAPITLSLSASPGLKLDKQKMGRAEAKETKEKGVAFDVPFTAAGKEELKGSLSFFICTEKLCERQKREVSILVEAERE